MLSADRTRQTLRLDWRVTIDLALFAARPGQRVMTSETMTLLHDALGMVDGPPFDGLAKRHTLTRTSPTPPG
jgi:hypothetical protein